MTSGADWLDVSSGVKLPSEGMRFKSVTKKLVGKSRVWACDGEYLAFRRKKANPATLQRHEAFIKSGDYKHLGTEDDVEIYKLMPTSPFARKTRDLTTIDSYNVRRTAAIAACQRDWGTFIDALEELSSRIKSRYHEAFAKTVYDENLTAVLLAINMRGGPSQTEIDREVQALRQRRGAQTSRIYLPPASLTA